MKKKFAQKLKEHNAHTGELLRVANELMSISKSENSKNNFDLAEQIADIAEKCTNLGATLTETFEEEYSEELDLLTQVVANKNAN